MVILQAGSVAPVQKLQARLRKWDQGNRVARIRQLEDFIDECSHMTGPQLEHYFENGASLFLARISSWLRLSYALGQAVGLLLQAIAVFVAASSGQRFLAEFVEVGGVATVVEILKINDLSQEDKVCATRLLGAVAAAGRHYKEIVCEGKGVGALESLMRSSKSEDQMEEVRDLIVLLGRGNPTFSTMVSAARGDRALGMVVLHRAHSHHRSVLPHCYFSAPSTQPRDCTVQSAETDSTPPCSGW